MIDNLAHEGLWANLFQYIGLLAPAYSSSPSCVPPTLSSYAFLISLLFQSALLHPSFKSSSEARLARFALMVPNVYWSLRFPFRSCFVPLASKGSGNMCLAAVGVYYSIKAIEWGCVSGPYWSRSLKDINGVKGWVSSKDDSKDLQQNQAHVEEKGLISWTISHFLSLRGHEFSWGPDALANQLTPIQLFLRIMKFHFIMRPALAFLILSRDSKDQSLKPIVLSLGIPDFPGLDLILTNSLNFSFGLLGYGCLELAGSSVTLFAYVIYNLSQALKLPNTFKEFFNPGLYPPINQPIFQSSSISYFWGNAWHQNLRRCFLVCGGEPARWLASRLRLDPNLRKTFGLFGAFAASAALHEYLTMVIRQPPHPEPYILFKSYPGSAIFFMLQPIGICIEKYISQTRFRTFVTGPIWTSFFLIITLGPYREACNPLFTNIPPLDHWSWPNWLFPSPIASLISGHS